MQLHCIMQCNCMHELHCISMCNSYHVVSAYHFDASSPLDAKQLSIAAVADSLQRMLHANGL